MKSQCLHARFVPEAAQAFPQRLQILAVFEDATEASSPERRGDLWLSAVRLGQQFQCLVCRPVATKDRRLDQIAVAGVRVQRQGAVTSVLFRSASVASARTQRDTTERGDYSTTTALAVRSAVSVTSS